jgi:predicted transposase/invertase (TIGR01784 family)
MKNEIKNKSFARLNPLNDYLFIKVMGEKGDEVQLLGFLNAVLGRNEKDRLASVEILENKTFSAEAIGDKSSILDVRAALQDGTKVNIEVQLRNLGNMDRRSLFYWSREFVKSLKAGQDYLELPNVIAINIVNFEFLETENFHAVFHLREDKENALVLTNALEIHFVDMVKYRKLRRKDILNEPLHRWLAWLDEGSPPELISEVISMDSAIQEADERMVYVSGDDEAIRAYEMRQMALSDLTSMKNYARKKGLSEGREQGLIEGREQGLAEGRVKGLAEGHTEGHAEGRIEGKAEDAKKMKGMGFSVEQIQAITDLSIEDIERL